MNGKFCRGLGENESKTNLIRGTDLSTSESGWNKYSGGRQSVRVRQGRIRVEKEGLKTKRLRQNRQGGKRGLVVMDWMPFSFFASFSVRSRCLCSFDFVGSARRDVETNKHKNAS